MALGMRESPNPLLGDYTHIWYGTVTNVMSEAPSR